MATLRFIEDVMDSSGATVTLKSLMPHLQLHIRD